MGLIYQFTLKMAEITTIVYVTWFNNEFYIEIIFIM